MKCAIIGSGLFAINIAILLDYKEIYLVGFDMYPGHLFEESPIYSNSKAMIKIINKVLPFQ